MLLPDKPEPSNCCCSSSKKVSSLALDLASMQTSFAATSNEHTMADTESGPALLTAQMVNGSQTVPAKPKEASGAPTVIPAIAPLRVLPIDPPAKGSVEGISLGAVRMRPYGFVKATMAYDTSDPRGDDFIVPGFLNSDTGPNKNPEFHIKARATRVGSRFEWPDMNGKMTSQARLKRIMKATSAARTTATYPAFAATRCS